MHLPPAHTRDIVVTRDIPIPMHDGAILLADHYAARNGIRQPTILIRSPYGRRGFFGVQSALPYAERGFQVLIQSCRGTAGSGGDFKFARNEHDDGLATIEWMKQQDWFSGEFATLGPSYLGFVQWATAADAGPELKAIIPQITTSDFNHFRYEGGSYTLESSLNWSTMMAENAATGFTMKMLLGMLDRNRKLENAFDHLPLNEADQIVIGRSTPLYQEVVKHAPDDDYWNPVNFSSRVPELTIPIYLMGGWYDLFLDWQLKDYQALRAAGRNPYLLIGPWFHGEFSSGGIMTRESLKWLQAHIKGNTSYLRGNPVRLYVMGANHWRNFTDWPPPAQNERWYLQPEGALATTPPPASEPDHYRYDPSDPTPAVGGNSLGSRKRMGAKDNRKLEARPDILVYTSPILDQDKVVIGPIAAELYVRSSLQHTDFFARLCAVESSGKSINLCDGIIRLTPDCITPQEDGTLHLQINIWPTAYHFSSGQRIRLQVSSGAHPAFVRNPGTGEPLGTATKLRVADQTVYHDPEHPSSIVLPIIPA
jgi:putative CocE/NonD family hydrolase